MFSFNNNNNAAPKPATGGTGFSFGQPSQQQTQQHQQQPQPQQQNTGFSFGAPSTNNTTTGGGLFGAPQNKPAGTGTTGGFSFGQPSTSTAQTSTGTGLGAGNLNTGTLFGTGNAQPAATSGTTGIGGGTNFFGGGGGGFGQQQQPQQQQMQQQQQQQPSSALLSHPYYQKERFNDLTDDSRKLLEELQKHITSQTNLRDEMSAKLIPSASSASNLSVLGQQISSLYSDLRYASISLSTMSSSLESELANVKRLAEAVETDRQDFANLWEIGNAFREKHTANPSAQGNHPGQPQNPSGPSHADASASSSAAASLSASTSGGGGLEARRDFLTNYLSKQISDFQSKILRYRSTISQIERHLSSLSDRDSHSPQAISDIIHFQHSTFMSLAGQVSSLHSEVEVLKRDYRMWYAKSVRSARDPFEMTDMAGNL